MTDPLPEFKGLIDQSSLGSDGARALRSRTSHLVVQVLGSRLDEALTGQLEDRAVVEQAPPLNVASDPTENLAKWSAWHPFEVAVREAPRLPGVYQAREGTEGPIVYVGMAGERRGRGLRGRLAVYASGKALASGLGEAVLDRALQDPTWLQQRLDEAQAGQALRAKDVGKAAFSRAGLEVRWTVVDDRTSAVALEQRCLAALATAEIWNRAR